MYLIPDIAFWFLYGRIFERESAPQMRVELALS